MLNTMYSVILLIIVIALILGFVIIYNMSIISFTEKDYQFATLKVLGFSNSKISKIFIKQNIWISLLSIILGLPFGYLITDYLFKYAIADNYDFFANINITSYIYSALITFILTILTSKFVSNKIKNIDMVKSLKSNE